MSENIKIIEIEEMGEITQHVIIERAPGEFTSMPKAVYDEMQAKQNEGIN